MTLDPREIAFRHFWNAYPFKIAVADARVAFSQALKIASAQELIEGAARFANDPNRVVQFTPYPKKWLDGQRWMDSALPPRTLSPQESAQLDKERAKVQNEREIARSQAISDEFEAAKARAIPLSPTLKAEILDKIARNLYPGL